MSEMVVRMQTQIKKTSGDLFLFGLKLISGAVLGLTLALIMHVVLGHADGENVLAFVFIMTVGAAAFLRLAKNWSLTVLLVFDLICILVGMLLRLYIMVAPEA
jgi:hypothetical protein